MSAQDELELPEMGELLFRYEDFAQDGRPLLRALPPALGAVWRQALAHQPLAERLRQAGIMPILTRIEIDLGDDSFSPLAPGRISGRASLRRAAATEGDHPRMLFDMQARVEAPTGHAHLPHGPSSIRTVGTLLGEHVLTRLFAAKDARRVSLADLEALGAHDVPERPWQSPQSIVQVEADAVPLDAGWARDPVPLAYGLMHTDANQHVNSLVYPQLFEEAVLRRLASLGRGERVAGRRLRIGYRKPSFAGEAGALELALFEQAGRLIAVGRFFGASESDPDRARVYVRMELTA